MAHVLLDAAHALADADLDRETRSLAARGRRATAELVAHLAEIEARELHLGAGYASLWEYCLDALRLSEGEASNRIAASRVARRFPLVLDQLASGELNLTTVREVARHLTPENHAQVLASVRGKRKDDVLRVVAALAPRADAPTSLRRVAFTPPAPGLPLPGTGASAPPPRVLPPPPATPPLVQPLAPERFRYQTTLSEDVVEMMRCARDMLSHASRHDDDELLRRAFSALLRQLARERFHVTDAPRAALPTTAEGSRHIPASVKRVVWVRDSGRCAFVATDGRRCSARAFLQFHHVRPYAAGGPPTVENIQLRCGAHNRFESKLHFSPSREVAPSQAR